VSLRIVHTFGRNAGAVQTPGKDVVRFGRAPDNDVVFDSEYDRDASGHHAELRREGAAWVLVDLGSRNGTFLRGRRIARERVASGDEIAFGGKGPRVRVEVVAEPAAAAPFAPARPAATVVDAPALDAFAATMGGPAPMAPAAQAFARPAPAPPAPPQPAPPAEAPAYPRAAPAPYGNPAAASPYAPPNQAVPLAPPAGARVGQRTIALMISQAVAAATGRSRPHPTHELNALVDAKVQAAVAPHRRTTVVLGVLLVVALAGLVGLVLWSRQSGDDIATLRSQLAGLPPNDPRRKEIEGRLGTLHPANASFGRNLYDRSKKGIFMLASHGQGFCTAFAVRPSVLATNAHCIYAARRAGGSVVALENEGRGQVSFAVTDMRPHPSYRDGDPNAITPDVGVVSISGKAAMVLELASTAELQATGAGDDVYLIGFPGTLMDPTNPAATFLAAHIGRLTGATGRPSPFAEDWLVQHDAPTTHGTSGSPVFDGRGKVIAVNAGGYVEENDENIAGKKTEVARESPYKFGMRIDLLDAVLR
jgi:hypothetical protein